ncbi:MAG: TIGR01777 family oxidoreductase [Fluviicola sp.]
METILIAGGTGLIGKKLTAKWKSAGHDVRILSRGKTDLEKNIFHYSIEKKEIDPLALENVSVIVNLAGAGIADKRWTKSRIDELYSSRIDSTEFLFEKAKNLSSLKQYISASGIICYGFDQPEKLFVESDPIGKDILSDITLKWEQAADLFSSVCPVAKIRISVVLSNEGGALLPISKPVKMGFGAILGNGKQGVPWIHLADLVNLFDVAMQQKWNGAYNANAGNTTNEELTRTIAKVLNKSIWLPKVPAFALKLVLGKMSTVVLDGLKADNSKIKAAGMKFTFPELKGGLEDLLK